MKLSLSKASVFSISVLVGLAVGYVPAAWYFQIGKNNVSLDGTFIDMSYTVIRGVITGVNQKSGILHIKAVSPFSPYESAPFSVQFDDSVLVRSTPSNPENSNSFLPSSEAKTVDTSHLVAGTPVTLRVSTQSGPLRATWIAVRSPAP